MSALANPVVRAAAACESRSAARFRAFWVALPIVAIGLPALAAALAGDLSIPHNDAFAYSRIARTFAESGSFRLVGWNHPFSLSQEVTLGPLASSLVVQQLFVMVVSVVALAATYVFLRDSLSDRRAMLGTALVAAFPGFGLLATSFMEDVPIYCATILTLVVGAHAIKRRSPAWLGLSAICGVWGFLTREQAAAALVAVLIAAFLRWPEPRLRRWVLTLATAVGAVVIAAELWRHSLPNGQQPTISFDPATIYSTAARAYFTFGLLCLPAALLGSHPRAWPRWTKLVAGLVTVFGLVFLVRDKTLLLGNYLDANGAYSSVLAGHRAVLPQALVDVLQVLSLVGGGLLVGELIVGVGRLSLQARLFAAFTVLGTFIEVLAGEPTFDRFLLVLVPVAMIMLLDTPIRRPPRIRWSASTAAVAAMLGLSLAITANGLAFDSARWSQATRLVRGGTRPQRIDAGLEWVGLHSPYPAVDAPVTSQRSQLPWYAQHLYPRSPECLILASSVTPGLGRLVRVASYRTFLVAGTSHLYVYDTGRCAPGRAWLATQSGVERPRASQRRAELAAARAIAGSTAAQRFSVEKRSRAIRRASEAIRERAG